MRKPYSNQNHAIHRSYNPFEKVANIYDKQGISNREETEKSLVLQTMTSDEAEAIVSEIEKEAAQLEDKEIDKTAAPLGNAFDLFGKTKNYIASKLGTSDDVAYDLSSSIMTKAEGFANRYGVDVAEAVTGIVDAMEPQEVQGRIGAVPMRTPSRAELEEEVKGRLMDSLGLSSFEADRVKKNVIQQTRNLLTIIRNVDQSQIAHAIIDVIIEHNDVSIVYDISTSDRLIDDVKSHLS